MQYLVLLPIAPFKRGDSFKKGQILPLHCTVMHWFELSEALTLYGLQDELQILARNMLCPLTLVSEKPALFGPNNDVPVHVLKPNAELHSLHKKLLHFLERKQWIPQNRHWIGPGYRPHVATVDGNAFVPNSTYDATELALLERSEGQPFHVQSVFSLGFHQ